MTSEPMFEQGDVLLHKYKCVVFRVSEVFELLGSDQTVYRYEIWDVTSTSRECWMEEEMSDCFEKVGHVDEATKIYYEDGEFRPRTMSGCGGGDDL